MLANTYSTNSSFLPSFSNIDHWFCSSCSFKNECMNYPTCILCHQIDSQFLQYTLVPSSSTSMWKCCACAWKNNEKNVLCESCFQPKHLSNKSPALETNSFASIIPRTITIRTDQNQSDMNIEETFKQIISYCKETKTRFVDDQFIPSNRSLGSDTFTTVSHWLRIRDIYPSSNRDSQLPWTVITSPKPGDIQQGALGNCWFLAALALITEQPRILRQILLTQTINDEGVYLIRLCHNGLWKAIIIDDCFPCTVDKQLVFSQAKYRQLYVPLIEKACAKLFSSYANLIKGTLIESLQLLTGAPRDYIDLQPSHRSIDSDIIWAKLFSACSSKLLIGATSSRSDITREEYAQVHIQDNHAFSILAVHMLSETNERFVLVRDPHARSNYTDTYVTPTILDQLRSINDTPRSSGAFWIHWSRFIRYFSSITISNYNKDNYDIRYEGKFTRSSTQSISTYQFHLTQTTFINISLIYHRHDRTTRCYHTQSFVLCDINEYSNVGKYEHILQSDRGGFTYWTGSLKPGNYIIIPYSISFWRQKTNENDYTLVIHSNNPLDLFIDLQSPTLLADCLISTIVKKYHQSSKENNLIYYVNPESLDSMFLVIENCSKTQYLNVQTKMTYSSNIQYSRHNLITQDCIPPCHRQLIFLAERTGEYHQQEEPIYTLDIESTIQMTKNYLDDLYMPRKV